MFFPVRLGRRALTGGDIAVVMIGAICLKQGDNLHVRCQVMSAVIGWDDGWRVLSGNHASPRVRGWRLQEVPGSPNSVPTLSGSYSAAIWPSSLPSPHHRQPNPRRTSPANGEEVMFQPARIQVLKSIGGVALATPPKSNRTPAVCQRSFRTSSVSHKGCDIWTIRRTVRARGVTR
jgi:hypothetical protein